jgi:hypothetical protein
VGRGEREGGGELTCGLGGELDGVLVAGRVLPPLRRGLDAPHRPELHGSAEPTRRRAGGLVDRLGIPAVRGGGRDGVAESRRSGRRSELVWCSVVGVALLGSTLPAKPIRPSGRHWPSPASASRPPSLSHPPLPAKPIRL